MTAISVPPWAGEYAIEPTVCVGSESPIECQLLPVLPDSHTPPLATAAYRIRCRESYA